jgi:hypothetical protein
MIEGLEFLNHIPPKTFKSSCYKLACAVAEWRAPGSSAELSTHKGASYLAATLSMRALAHVMLRCGHDTQIKIFEALNNEVGLPTAEDVKMFRAVCGNLFSLSVDYHFPTYRMVWKPQWANLIIQLGARVSCVSNTTKHSLPVVMAYLEGQLIPRVLPVRVVDGIRTLFCVFVRHRLVGMNRDVRNRIARACALADWLYMGEWNARQPHSSNKRARHEFVMERSTRALMYGTKRMSDADEIVEEVPLRVRVCEAWRAGKFLDVAQLLCVYEREEVTRILSFHVPWDEEIVMYYILADAAIKGNLRPLQQLHQWRPGDVCGQDVLVTMFVDPPPAWMAHNLPSFTHIGPIKRLESHHIPLALCVLDIMKDNGESPDRDFFILISSHPRLMHRAGQLGLFWPKSYHDWNRAWLSWSLAKHSDRMFYTLEFRAQANLFLRGSHATLLPRAPHGVGERIAFWLAVLYSLAHTPDPGACRTVASCRAYMSQWGLKPVGGTQSENLQRIVREHRLMVDLYLRGRRVDKKTE